VFVPAQIAAKRSLAACSLERDMEYFVEPEEALGTRGDASE
jgi:hypothetical protein